MIITIYPSICTLYQGDYIAQQWVDYRFASRPKLAVRMETGFIKVRVPVAPIGIKVHLAAITDDGKWARLADGNLYCAWHVFLMAERGKKGMSVVKK